MPRSTRSDIASLLLEARAIELLADEADVPPHKLQEYWSLAADLINLVVDIEALQAEEPDATYEDPRMLALRRKLRDLTGRLAEISSEVT